MKNNLKYSLLIILLLNITLLAIRITYKENLTGISVFEDKLYLLDTFSSKISEFSLSKDSANGNRPFTIKEIDLDLYPDYGFDSFLQTSPLSSYLFDAQAKSIYKLNSEYILEEKYYLKEFEDIDLAPKFYSPAYNSLLFMDKFDKNIYLLESGVFTKITSGNDGLIDFYCNKNNIFCLYPEAVKLFNTQGILLKTFPYKNKNEGEKIFTLKNKLYILCKNEIIELETNSREQRIISLGEEIREFAVIENKLIYFTDKEMVIRKLK